MVQRESGPSGEARGSDQRNRIIRRISERRETLAAQAVIYDEQTRAKYDIRLSLAEHGAKEALP